MLGFERPNDFETFRTSIVTARALCACRLTNVCGNKQKKRAKCMHCTNTKTDICDRSDKTILQSTFKF